MAEYTYSGNLLAGEKTERLILRGGDLILSIGQWADLTGDEYAALSSRYLLTPGRSAIPGGPSESGLHDLLSQTAIDELVALVDAPHSIGACGLPPAWITYLTSN